MSAIGTATKVTAAPIKRGQVGVNMAANFAQLGLSIIIASWYVPFLVRSLGPASYGMIPLATAITAYMSLITLALNSTVGRSMTIALEQGDDAKANLIFNTSLWGSIGLTAILLVVAAFGMIYIESLIKVPPGFASEARWLFAGTVGAFLLNEIKTPFDVATFCRNRFDLRNFVGICEILTRVGLVVVLFYVFTPSIKYVGFGILSGTIVSTIGAIFLWRKLTPTLWVQLRQFDWKILGDLTHTGGWVVISHLGNSLFNGIDLLVSNRLFGAEQTGKYGAILAIPILVQTLGATASVIFQATIFQYYARKDIDGLVLYLRRASKCLGLMTALPVALVCGFAEPLLSLWLKPSFVDMSPVLILLTVHLAINVSILPLSAPQLAANRLKFPGLMTLAMGVANVGLALFLAGPMHLKLYGIAASGAILLTLKNSVFTPIYGAHILGRPYTTFYRGLGLILAVTAGTALTFRGIAWVLPVTTWPQLIAAGISLSLLYWIVVYRLILTLEERTLLRSMIPFRKVQA